MKIAIPTDDGINVALDFESAKGYLIVTLQLGEIISEDIRWRNDTAVSTPLVFCAGIADCSLVIARKPDDSGRQLFSDHDVTIIYTSDEIITNAIFHYLEHEHLAASNSCCCP